MSLHVVLREGNVKDEGGFGGVFAERDASALQMEAAKVLDSMPQFLGMAEERRERIANTFATFYGALYSDRSAK